MGYVDASLVPGETVAYRTRLHWIVFAPALLLGGLCDLGGTALLVFAFVGRGADGSMSTALLVTGAILMLIGSAWLAAGAIRWKATEITVTSRRVLIKTGVMTIRTTEVLLAKVESVAVEESPIGRMLGFGKVTIHGTGGTPERFERIAQPLEFRRRVQIGIEGLPR
ncbi:MAG TPA: PH domain-containing protein [Candidatus Eisenbacteria bacterium]|nr:PH domain-containing protein [Candidatus Eisenbacteria bacterium]